MRRTFGALLTILAVTLVYQSEFDLHAQVMPGSLEIKLDLAATMPSRSGPALTLTHADDGSNRIFAGGRNGRVELIKDGAVQETPFLDMRDLRDEFRVNTSGGEGVPLHSVLMTTFTSRSVTAAGGATSWGEGDWNSAPGGEPGSPPTGDGLFNQLDVIASQLNALYLTGPYAAIASGGSRGDGQTSIIYDANTGEIAVDAPAGIDLTSVNIDSATGIFTGRPARNLGGSFDNDADNNLFKATFGSSFGSLSFGNVAQPILTEAFVRSDLTVVGSLAGGGDLGAVDLIYIPLPEPTAFCLLIMGVLGAIACRWPVGRSS